MPEVAVAPLPCIKPCIVPPYEELPEVTLKPEVANLPFTVSKTPEPETFTLPERPEYPNVPCPKSATKEKEPVEPGAILRLDVVICVPLYVYEPAAT